MTNRRLPKQAMRHCLYPPIGGCDFRSQEASSFCLNLSAVSEARMREGLRLARPSLKAALNWAAVLCLCSTSSFAANITLAPLGDDPAHAIVLVEGRLESGDEIQFRTQVGRLTKARVLFNSDGGYLF